MYPRPTSRPALQREGLKKGKAELSHPCTVAQFGLLTPWSIACVLLHERLQPLHHMKGSDTVNHLRGKITYYRTRQSHISSLTQAP